MSQSWCYISRWLLLFLLLYGHICSFPGEGNGNPLQYSYLESPVNRGDWWAAVHWVTQSQTGLKQLSMHAHLGEGNGNPLQNSCLENPRDRGARWAAVYGVAQSLMQLKQLSSSSSSLLLVWLVCVLVFLFGFILYGTLCASWTWLFPFPMHESEKWKGSRSVISDSSWPHRLQPTRLLHPWGFPGKSTGVGCHCLLLYAPSNLVVLILASQLLAYGYFIISWFLFIIYTF